MQFQFTEEQKKFKEEVCSFCTSELTPEIVAKNSDPREYCGYTPEFERLFLKKLVAAGFIGVTWPEQYGGGGKDIIHNVILAEEMEHHQAPPLDLTFTYLPTALLAIASEDQKNYYLPRIKRGEIRFWLGYSEPEAGSDLANIQMHADVHDNHFTLTGQKLFSSRAEHADFGWVAARTSSEEPKHKGLSLFIVDMKTPGIIVDFYKTVAGWKHAAVSFDNVYVPKTNLVGELNRGFFHIMKALGPERAFIGNAGMPLRSLDLLIDYCRETKLTKDPIIRQKLADLAIDVEAVRLISYWIGSMYDARLDPEHNTSLSLLIKRETQRRIDYAGLEILGPYAQLKKGSKYAPLEGTLEYNYRNNLFFHFTAGGFDVTKNIIAVRGLGLPR